MIHKGINSYYADTKYKLLVEFHHRAVEIIPFHVFAIESKGFEIRK